jgi:hypothetical protein
VPHDTTVHRTFNIDNSIGRLLFGVILNARVGVGMCTLAQSIIL